MSDDLQPFGFRVLCRDGDWVEIGDENLQQWPDEKGLKVWVVTVPAGLALKVPPQVRVEFVPGRCTIGFDFSRYNDAG